MSAAPTASDVGNAEAQALAATREMFGAGQQQAPPQNVGEKIEAAAPGVFPPVEVPPMMPPVQPAAPPEAAAEEQEDTEFDVAIPPEIQAILDEPDLDEDEDEWEEPTLEAVAEPNEYEDPEVAELRKRLNAAEKKAAHYEKLRVQSARKQWVAEAKEFFPLSTPDTIQADSRKGFLRAAKAQHDTLKPTVEAYLTSEREKLRAHAAQQWGAPIAAGPQVPSEAAALANAEQAAFDRGGLQGGIKQWITSGRLKL